MLIKNPKEFESKARNWAVQYAGAPKKALGESSGGATEKSIQEAEQKAKEEDEREALAAYVSFYAPFSCDLTLASRYEGYNKQLIDRFVNMGFDVDRVVSAFKFVGIDRMGGEDYELEEAYMGDITARLLGEP